MNEFIKSDGSVLSSFDVIEYKEEITRRTNFDVISIGLTDRCIEFIKDMNHIELMRFNMWFRNICEFSLEYHTHYKDISSVRFQSFCIKYNLEYLLNDSDFVKNLDCDNGPISNSPYRSYVLVESVIDSMLSDSSIFVENDILSVKVTFNTKRIIINDFYILIGDSKVKIDNRSCYYVDTLNNIVVASILNECDYIKDFYDVNRDGNGHFKYTLRFLFPSFMEKSLYSYNNNKSTLCGYRFMGPLLDKDEVTLSEFNKVFKESMSNSGRVCTVSLNDINSLYRKLHVISKYIKFDYNDYVINVVSNEKRMLYREYSAKLLEATITNELNIEEEFKNGEELVAELIIGDKALTDLNSNVITDFILRYCDKVMYENPKYTCDNVVFIQEVA